MIARTTLVIVGSRVDSFISRHFVTIVESMRRELMGASVSHVMMENSLRLTTLAAQLDQQEGSVKMVFLVSTVHQVSSVMEWSGVQTGHAKHAPTVSSQNRIRQRVKTAQQASPVPVVSAAKTAPPANRPLLTKPHAKTVLGALPGSPVLPQRHRHG